jgi:hypothetical protein
MKLGSMHEVQHPVSATEQNNGTSDDCRNYQYGHLNLLYLSPYAISVHNIRTGMSISPKSICLLSEVVTKKLARCPKVPNTSTEETTTKCR